MTNDDNGSGELMGPPAPRPCEVCPYRRDVPSGVWDPTEYEKLRPYDADTVDQPTALFQCHLRDADDPARRMCGGWVGCHGHHLYALRLAILDERITAATFAAAVAYRSPIPLFTSAAEAADHGQRHRPPDPATARAIAKIRRLRTGLAEPDDDTARAAVSDNR